MSSFARLTTRKNIRDLVATIREAASAAFGDAVQVTEKDVGVSVSTAEGVFLVSFCRGSSPRRVETYERRSGVSFWAAEVILRQVVRTHGGTIRDGDVTYSKDGDPRYFLESYHPGASDVVAALTRSSYREYFSGSLAPFFSQDPEFGKGIELTFERLKAAGA